MLDGSSACRSSSCEEPTSAAELGEPSARHCLEFLDGISVLSSLLALVAAYLVISSELPWAWAWKLGMTNQITIVGFLLSIQTLCLRRIVPLCWLMLEAKYGSSILQNYDAILQNTALIRHTAPAWRCIITLFLLLPIALSVAYKQFGNHTTFRHLNGASIDFGLFGPPGLNDFGYNAGLYLMTNATQPYMIASRGPQPVRSDNKHVPWRDLPGIGYGFNNLNLPSRASAFLDVPRPEVINKIQARLRPTETQYLGANVSAIVTTHHASRGEAKTSTGILEPVFIPLTRFHDLGMFIDHELAENSSWCFLGITPAPRTLKEFQRSAQWFVTHRKTFEGWWSITAASMRMESGRCDDKYSNQEYFISSKDRTWIRVYMQALSELLGSHTGNKTGSQPTTSSMANALAAMYWSRFVVMDGPAVVMSNPESKHRLLNDSNSTTKAHRLGSLYRIPVRLYSSVQTLDNGYPLYLIVGLQTVHTSHGCLLHLVYEACSHTPGIWIGKFSVCH